MAGAGARSRASGALLGALLGIRRWRRLGAPSLSQAVANRQGDSWDAACQQDHCRYAQANHLVGSVRRIADHASGRHFVDGPIILPSDGDAKVLPELDAILIGNPSL